MEEHPVLKPNFIPPGAEGAHHTFEEDFDEHFHVPSRLVGKKSTLVNAVNDFHFAMMNDHDRNEFYRVALEAALAKEGPKKVLEIGAGSGLLSMIAAKNGADHVYAIEASSDLVQVATQCIGSNQLLTKVSLINKLSSHVGVPEIGGEKADILVSEILGTMLLGEDALQYVSDARRRLLKPGAKIIPSHGCQFATLIQSPDISSITSVQGWRDVNLQSFNQLQDTVSMVFSKQYGFRMSSVPFDELSERIPVADVDFTTCEPGFLPPEQRIRFRAKKTGVVHAVMCSWDVYGDETKQLVMSTDPSATKHNFPRDMQWGQALQLVEDCSVDTPTPQPLHVTEGEELDLIVLASADSVTLQFLVERASASSEEAMEE